ncbi:hypothetical protein [Clostridium sp. M14]|uniref:hypothetical protein n=1 Tax=Clostridium sp. M14 TaxID=2716311 RepID=UPI0013EECD47|nr:hypothetical protein [Clostridium sp. M14]MBZ9693319.1 hypothetical protein [Clostridium sp. M14]
MKNYENANEFKKIGLKPHEILIITTSYPDYEMYRNILLGNGIGEGVEWGEYLLLEGFHCSCYDFDETDWTGTVYTKEELIKLSDARYNKDSIFWKQVREQLV